MTRALTSTQVASRLTLIVSTVVGEPGREVWGPWAMFDVSDLATAWDDMSPLVLTSNPSRAVLPDLDAARGHAAVLATREPIRSHLAAYRVWAVELGPDGPRIHHVCAELLRGDLWYVRAIPRRLRQAQIKRLFADALSGVRR